MTGALGWISLAEGLLGQTGGFWLPDSATKDPAMDPVFCLILVICTVFFLLGRGADGAVRRAPPAPNGRRAAGICLAKHVAGDNLDCHSHYHRRHHHLLSGFCGLHGHADGTAGTGPTLKGIFGTTHDLAGGGTVKVDDNYIRESILEPQAKIRSGYQPVMSTYKGLVSDEDITALIEYIKTLE